MSNFAFLKENPAFEMFAEACMEAERSLAVSPVICALGARRAFEQAIEWVYLAEHEALPDPYDRMRAVRRGHFDEPLQFRKLSALYHEREFRALLNDDHLWQSLQYIIKAGNIAAHRNSHLQRADAVFSLSVLFDFISWIDYCYGKPSGTGQGGFHGRLRAFDASALPAPGAIVDPKALKAREDAARATYEKQLDAKDSRILELEKLVGEMSEQLAARRAERPPLGPIDADKLNEYETRRRYIDLDLQMVGWDMRHDVAIEYPVTGMEGKPGANGRIDYLLKGRDGRPLAIIEAKRTSYDPSKGLQQARLYADCIERDTGRRPLIFLSNGYKTFFADDNGTYRPVGEIFSQDDMQRIMNRLDGSTPVIDPSLVKVNTDVAGGGGRAYQLEAIRRVCDVINKGDRTALLAMATGTGKTRVSAAIVDVLRRAGRVTNVLFLADRTELVAQAASAYGEYFPDWSLCNLCANKRDADAEVVFSTYQTMVNMIDSAADPTGGDKPTFTSGHFDMIIVDEAHRSIFKKFKVIFDHFDAFTMGLTATPRDEFDRNTYDFFKLQEHMPTFVYEYETALADGVLVPYRNIEVETAFMTEGITYDDLSDEDKERFEEDFGGGGDSAVIADDGFDDSADDSDDSDGDGSARTLPEDMPDHISAGDINKRVMNANTVDRVIDDLLAHGIRTDGGQRLGKTIIFAQNQAHARYIVQRFGEREPKMAANGFIKVVVSSDDRSGSIIKEFKLQPNPVVAVSVDMMDTGVDVPEVVNLVFFKRVRSKIKFLQMLGRGTRLCPGLDCVEGVAPGDDADADTEDAGMAGEYVGKRRFMVFDYCGNFEFFRQHKDTVEPAMPKSLSERIFARKVELARALQSPACTADEGLLRWRGELVDDLHGQVAALDGTKASVRTKREYVERYRDRKAFDHLGDLNVRELVKEVAPLAHYDDDDQYALRFDALMYSLMAVAAGALGPSVGVTGTGADAGAGPGAGADADTTASDMRARPTAPDGTPTTATSFASVAGMTGMASAKSRNAHIAKVRQSVRRLMDRMTIPAVASQRALIERIANDDGYLRDAPLPELERIRLALRGLIRYSVDDANRHIIITDLTDPVTQRAEGLPFDMREDYEDYRLKVNRYINEHLGDGAIAKLRHNQPLTADDWSELEQVFTKRLGTNAEYEEAFRDESFGMTVRRIAKLDHAAAQEAFAGFIAAHTLNGDQIAFMNRVIAYVEQNGTIDMADLIKPPFDRPMPLIRLFGGNAAVLSDLADSIRRMNANAMAPAA